MIKTITINEALQTNAIFIDTRSPQEFQEDHMPGAINLPILDNDERHLVGTIYKQVSKQEAIDKGKEIFAKKLPHFQKELSKHKNKTIIVNCFRGGMRSRAVVATFSDLNIHQLQGGYKAYRAYVREQLTKIAIPELIVLCGLTCTGKTDILKLLPNVIDLEGLAQHRSSMYGAVGLKPNSQKRFESLLLQQLQQSKQTIFIEGESRRIGDVIIPEKLWKKMCNSKKILITRTLDNRATACVQEYFNTKDKITQIRTVTTQLFKVISKANQQLVLQHIDNKQYHQAAKILLEKYYDPLYAHTLDQLTYQQEISSNNLQEAIKILNSL